MVEADSIKEPCQSWINTHLLLFLLLLAPEFANFCCMYSDACYRAETDDWHKVQKALDMCLECPQNSDEIRDWNKLLIEAHSYISYLCRSKIQTRQSPKSNRAKIFLQNSQELLSLVTENTPLHCKAMVGLASAYCLSGNNLEGARWYRKALVTGQLDDSLTK